MKTSRSLIALTATNLACSSLVPRRLHAAFAQADGQVLRGRALEIVDGQGRVRASINVLPSGKSPNGEETPDRAASTQHGAWAAFRQDWLVRASSGLSFAGPTGTKDTYVILQSKGTVSVFGIRERGWPRANH